jgi:hypothetical protein
MGIKKSKEKMIIGKFKAQCLALIDCLDDMHNSKLEDLYDLLNMKIELSRLEHERDYHDLNDGRRIKELKKAIEVDETLIGFTE